MRCLFGFGCYRFWNFGLGLLVNFLIYRCCVIDFYVWCLIVAYCSVVVFCFGYLIICVGLFVVVVVTDIRFSLLCCGCLICSCLFTSVLLLDLFAC